MSLMYTQIQRFVATILLCSMLLQSCGNPNCKMVEPADAGSSGKTSKPKSLAPFQPINQQKDASEGAMKVGSAPTIDRFSEASAAVANEAPYTRPNTLSGEARAHSRSSTSSPAAARSLVVPASKVSQASRSASVLKNPPIHGASKPQRAVPDKAPASPHALHSNQPVVATPPPTSVKPSDRTTPLSRPLQRAVRLPQTEVESRSDDTAHQAPSRAPLSSAAQLYPSAQGHQVGFQEEKGVWQAQVTNVWGCTQKLPVIGAPDQAPEQAIQQLASKAPGQHKYCIHVLETHQPPWAPRVVYVGALGVRGGGNSSSSDNSGGGGPRSGGSGGGSSRSDDVFIGGHMEGIGSRREAEQRFAAYSRARMRDVDFTISTSHPDPVERMSASTRLVSSHRAEMNRTISEARNNFDRSIGRQYESYEAPRHSRQQEEAPRHSRQQEEAPSQEEIAEEIARAFVEIARVFGSFFLLSTMPLEAPRREALRQHIGREIGRCKIGRLLLAFGRDGEEQRRKQEEARRQEEQEAQVPTAYESAASVQEDEDNSVEEVYTEYSAMPSNPRTSASASPSVARAQEEQEAEEPLPTPWQGVPFVQPEAPDLAAMLQRNLQLNDPATGDQVEEDSKMPSLPRVTTFDTPAEAQEAVETFLERWNLETPAGRAALQEQGQEILKGVEALKKEYKQSYRHQVLGFETKDVDPLVWERVLQEQEATKVQLNAVRGLRAQLLDTCQVRGAELEEAGLRTTFDEDKQEEVLYSSDEEEQQMSSEAMRDRQASIKKGIDVTNEVVEAILESGPTLGAGAAVKVAGKLPKVVKAAKATKAAGQAAQRVTRAGKGTKVLQSGGHTLKKRTLKALGLNGEKAKIAIEAMKDDRLIPPNFHGQIMKNGDFIHPHTKEVLGNIYDYVN